MNYLNAIVVLCLLVCGCTTPRTAGGPMPKVGSVASVNPLATRAAVDVLESGGNAIDAAVAAMLTLGVVDGYNSGIGGGCFIVIRKADGRVIAIDGRETAPALATRDMFLRDGKAVSQLSQTGPLAVAVPGALRAYDSAVKRFGTRSLSSLILPAAKIAKDGFVVSNDYANRVQGVKTSIDASPSLTAILAPSGTLIRSGETLLQTDLAQTYTNIAEQGVDWFYAGEFADRLDTFMRENNGLIRKEDLAGYRAIDRKPLLTTYRGHTIIGMPPPSSGGVHVAQILSTLERFDLGAMSAADRITVQANAMSLAFADRAEWLGDPDFARVPKGLISQDYLKTRSSTLLVDRAMRDVTFGQPADTTPFDQHRHTTHVSVIDAKGNAVSITATINTTFGAKFVVPGTGVFLNNEMDDFAAQPGVANHFGLVGKDANSVAPGKRPLSSMSPTIVVKEGRVIAVVGAAGGPRIITQVVCVLINLIDLRLSPLAALAEPRVHHQWRPDKLWIETTSPASLRLELRARGFDLQEVQPVGATNLATPEAAVSEPRLTGEAWFR